MSVDQVSQLKGRLSQLVVGMSREKVLEIINLNSFNLHPFESANSTGLTYHIADGHTLEIGLERGDYDSTLRWARFDGEVWPKNYERPQRVARPPQ
jgi:hypothetical protein